MNNCASARPRFLRVMKHFSFVILLIASCSLFIACRDPLSPPKHEITLPSDSGSFSLKIAGTSARTILPETPVLTDFAVYTLAFTATSGGADLTVDRTNATYANPIVLVAGTYSLTVSAYGDNAKSQLMAQGTINVAITAGANTPGTIVLKPLLTSGSGNFSWDITFDTTTVTVDAATMTIKDSSGTIVDTAVNLTTAANRSGSKTLDSGIYTVTFDITDSVSYHSVVWNELLYVYSSLTGNFTYTITDAHFRRTHWNVTFDYDNGKTYEHGSHPDLNLGSGTQSIENGGLVPAPLVDRPGYLFSGWYTDTACTTEWNIAAGIVHNDMTLYAKWIPNTAGITLSVEEIANGTADLTFANPINAITVVRAAGHAQEEYMVAVSGDYASAEWRIAAEGANTAETIVNTSTITLSGTDPNYNRLGGHILMLTVTLADGNMYRLNIPFTVKEPPTPGLAYELIGTTAYRVRKGSVTSGKVIIPSEYNGLPVTEIGSIYDSTTNGAFANTSITSVDIPDSITFIGRYAFSCCSGLTGALTLPDGLTSIGDYAFEFCSGFTGDLIISTGVTSMGHYIFRNCTNITSVTFEVSGVTDIGALAFPGNGSGTDTLKTLYATEGAGTYVRTLGLDDWVKQP